MASFYQSLSLSVYALFEDSDRDKTLIAKVFPCDVQPLISLKIIKEKPLWVNSDT